MSDDASKAAGELALSFQRAQPARPQERQFPQPSDKADRQEFFLPVSGFVWFYPEEVEVINHPAFQRLGCINQLGQAFHVYRGATHKRIEHTLGVVGVIQRMIAAVDLNARKCLRKNGYSHARPLTDSEVRFVRLGALLHDIGHLSAGHTLEDELGLVDKHDADTRLTKILEKDQWTHAPAPSPTLASVLDRHFAFYLPPKLKKAKLTPTDVVRLLIRKQPTQADDVFAAKHAALLASSDIRYHVCSTMIGNTICADLLDYIYRDWYHVGKPRSADDRIFQYMEIRSQSRGKAPDGAANVVTGDHPPASADDRFVIAIGSKTRIRTDGISAILGLLEWRYELAEAVLFHRTKVAAVAMLDRALFELWENDASADLVERILELSDDELIDRAIDDSAKRSADGHENGRTAHKILCALKGRRLFGTLATFDHSNLTPDQVAKIKQSYIGGEGDTADPKLGARNRAEAARNIELDFDLPAGSVAIYCVAVRPKIAEVTIAIDEFVLPFNRLEDELGRRGSSKLLSGGHLEAQVDRFNKLWRIYFLISKEVRAGMTDATFMELQQAVERVVVSDAEPNALEYSSQLVAKARVLAAKDRGKNSVRFVDHPVEFARGDPKVGEMPRYPNGAPCIRNFVKVEG